MSNTVLKGGISYNKYVWHSSENACEICSALDGTEYDYEKDIPDRPHANCKCYIETIENSSEDNELCDCLDDLYDEIDELVGEGQSLQEEILASIFELSSYLQEQYIKPIRTTVEGYIHNLNQIFGTIGGFIKNYIDMRVAKTKDADKYFHSKANCNGAQRGELGEEVAKGISDLREYIDLYKNIYIKGMSEIESAKDSAEDQAANEYGRKQGKSYPDSNCDDLIKKYRPDGRPPQY